MPSEPPASNFKEKIKLTAYPCVEAGGLIWAYMGPPELRTSAQLPEFEWMRVPESHRYIRKTVVASNYLQGLEGSIDNTHAGFLHSTFDPRSRFSPDIRGTGINLARASVRSWVKYELKETDYGYMVGGYRVGKQQEPGKGSIVHFLLPHYALPRGGGPGDTRLCVLRTPIDDEHHWFIWLWWNHESPLTKEELARMTGPKEFGEMIPGTYLPLRNKDNDWLIDRDLQRSYNYTGIKTGAPPQDMMAVISMGPIVDRTKEHLGTSDEAILAVRRYLIKMARALQQGEEPYAAYHGEVYRVRQADIVQAEDAPFFEEAEKHIKASV